MATPRGNTYTVASGDGIYAGIARPATNGAAPSRIMSAIAALLAGGAAAPAPAPAPAVGTGGEAAFSVSTTAGVTNEAFAVGMALAEGQFPGSSGITVSGVTSPQVDIHSTWPDGSAKVAVVSGRITLAAASSARCVLRQGTASTGALLTEANLLASGVDATLQFGGGPVMTLSSLIGVAAVSDATGLVTAGRVRQLSSGHQMSSWLYAARLSAGNAHVIGWMEVRFYGGNKVHVLPWVENGFARIGSCAGQAGTLTFTLGGTTRFTQADVHLANHCRVAAQDVQGVGYWAGTAPDLFAAPDPLYLQATKLVPAYFPDTAVASTQLNALTQAYSPTAYGQLTTSPRDSEGNGTANGEFDNGMAAAGYHRGIGLLPDWDAYYLTSGDVRAWRSVIANAMGYGRYGTHWRDELTLAPVNPADVPNKTLAQVSTVARIAAKAANITLSGTSGTITITADADVFSNADANRAFATADGGRATVSGASVTNPRVLTATVTTIIPATSYSAGQWSVGINRNVSNIADVGANQFDAPETLPAASGLAVGDGTSFVPEYWAQTHHPRAGFLAYLLTGHEFFLESVQFVAGVCFLRQNNNYREYGLGIQKTNRETVRGQAWGLLSIFQAAAVSRDGSALKTGFGTIAANNVTYYNTEYISGPLGLSGAFGTPRNSANFRADTADYRVNAFEYDFSVGAWGYGCQLKPVSGASLTSMLAYFQWHGQWPVVRLGPLGDANTFGFNCAARNNFIAVAPGRTGSQWDTNTGWYANPGEMFKDTPGGRMGLHSAVVGTNSLSVSVTGVGAERDVFIDVSGITGAGAVVRVQISTDNSAWSPTGTTVEANTTGVTFNDGLTGQRYVRLSLESNAGGGTVFARCSRPSSSNATNTTNTIGAYVGDDATNGYFPDATSYWGNLQVAVMYAVELGVPGAEAAYNRMVGASNWGSFETSAATAPGYAHRPRNVPQWGLGSATGSVVGDVWTPGKDTQGRVNKASWAAVPTGRWIEAAGTRIDTQLTTAVQAVSPGWTSALLWGTSAGTNLMQSWSGFTPPDKLGRFWFFGGGHSDGHNNGLYRFDTLRMQWAIECAPTAWDDMTVQYRTNGDATFHPDSMATALANFNANNAPGTMLGTLVPAVNGPCFDEIPTDGKPAARHTYHGLAYAPDLGAQGSLFMHMRRLWRYDIASGRWVLKRLFDDKIRSFDNPYTPGPSDEAPAPNAVWLREPHAGEASVAIWDEVGQKVICSASGSIGAGVKAYNWAAQTWGNYAEPYGLNYNHAAMARNGRTVAFFTPPRADNAGYRGRYWVHNLDTGTTTTGTDVQLGGGLTLASFPTNSGPYAFYDAEAMVYVPPINRYWVWTRSGAGPMLMLELDPTTTPWTLSPLTHPNASPMQQTLAVGRVQWVEALNAVLAWDHCFVGAKLYKF